MTNPIKKTVDTIMSREVVTVVPNEYLLTLRALLNQRGIHHLLVVEEGELVGVISDRDVLQALSPFLETMFEQPRDIHTLEIRASEIMSRNPLTITPDTSVAKAISLLLSNNISSLPVIDDEGNIAGIVTSRDILKQEMNAE